MWQVIKTLHEKRKVKVVELVEKIKMLSRLWVIKRFLSLFISFRSENSDKKDHIMLDNSTMLNEYGVPIKRQRITPPLSERVMLYVRQDNEDVYTPLHVVPPTTQGLVNAVSQIHPLRFEKWLKFFVANTNQTHWKTHTRREKTFIPKDEIEIIWNKQKICKKNSFTFEPNETSQRLLQIFYLYSALGIAIISYIETNKQKNWWKLMNLK